MTIGSNNFFTFPPQYLCTHVFSAQAARFYGSVEISPGSLHGLLLLSIIRIVTCAQPSRMMPVEICETIVRKILICEALELILAPKLTKRKWLETLNKQNSCSCCGLSCGGSFKIFRFASFHDWSGTTRSTVYSECPRFTSCVIPPCLLSSLVCPV